LDRNHLKRSFLYQLIKEDFAAWLVALEVTVALMYFDSGSQAWKCLNPLLFLVTHMEPVWKVFGGSL
jgi:hypothetical protein